MLQSKIDPTAWRMEVERVAPKLRITLAADAKDWRSHLEEVGQHSIRRNLSLDHLTEDHNATTAEDTVIWQRIVQRSVARARQCAHVTAVPLLVAEGMAVVVPRDFPAWLSGPKIQPIIHFL